MTPNLLEEEIQFETSEISEIESSFERGSQLELRRALEPIGNKILNLGGAKKLKNKRRKPSSKQASISSFKNEEFVNFFNIRANLPSCKAEAGAEILNKDLTMPIL